MSDGRTLLDFVDRQHKSKISIARGLGMSRRNLYNLFESKQLTDASKKKFEDFFKLKIFKTDRIDKRVINGDEPSAPLLKVAAYDVTEHLGTPIKLQIATQLMAAHVTGSVYAGFPYKSDEVAAEALKDADALLKAYNNQ